MSLIASKKRNLRIGRILPVCLILVAPLKAEAPAFRLSNTISPVRYRLDLTLVPDEPTFAGTVEIDLQIHAATSEIWLHSYELTIRQATLTAQNNPLPARILTGKGLAGFAFEHPILPGDAVLRLKFEGRLNASGRSGLFKMKEGNDWYIFSQFQTMDARRAFPCFDEPSFKTPWQLTLHVKGSHTALSNAPAISETPEAGDMKAVRFAETKPLPAYLVAVAVGPLDLVDAGSAGSKHIPIHIVTPRGKSAEAAYAREMSPRIVEVLEDYFGAPYPYEKLDCVAVPLLGFAMENAGLVTFDQTMILARSGAESVQWKRGYSELAAHEFAHQWFGNLVTPAWWDDLWLNESFATWMAEKTVARMKPEWKVDVAAVSRRSWVMNLDTMASVRKIRQPVESEQDMAGAFDAITYVKGATVIHMFERWIGEEKFQQGIRFYLERHSWRNASAADFLADIGAAVHMDVAPAFSSFLDQPGAPLVSATLNCGSRPRLALAQARAAPLGSQTSSRQTWQIPVCVKSGRNSDAPACALMTSETLEIPLKNCPDWLLADDGERGYFRVQYQGNLFQRLLQDNGARITLAERVGVLGDVEQLALMGKIPAVEALALVPRFRREPEPEITDILAEIAGLPYRIIPSSLWPNYSRFVRRMFGDRARALGWQEHPRDTDDTRLLRATLVPLVTIDGEDRVLIGEVTRLARRWLEDRRAIDPALTELALRAAAKYGDKILFEKFLVAAKSTQDPAEKQKLVRALGSFQDRALANSAMELALGGDFESRYLMDLLLAPTANLRTQDLPFRFVQQHYDVLRATLAASDNGESTASLPHVARRFCDEDHRSQIEAFFKDRASAAGGPRVLAEVLEQVHLCSTRRESQLSGVAGFLRKY